MANISGTDEDIQNRTSMIYHDSSRVKQKSPVNFGPVITEISM